MRIALGLVVFFGSILIGSAATAVNEDGGGFRFSLPDDFSLKPNPRKKTYPATQFDTAFSRVSRSIIIPAGFRDPSLSRAIDASVKLLSDGFEVKVAEVERDTLTSKSGVSVTRVLANVEGGDFKFVLIVAFSPSPKSAVTYSVTPGDMSKDDALKVVAEMIESLEIVKKRAG